MSTPDQNGPTTTQLLIIGFTALTLAISFICFIAP
ncbi:MAG: hypothetical protein RL199_473 [Pseudomonadota bacterium]